MSEHRCGWPGCTVLVPEEHWACGPHWDALPQDIRRDIWRSYVPGQDLADASEEFVRAILAADNWIRKTFGADNREPDPGRWERLVAYVREQDRTRPARMAAARAARAQTRAKKEGAP